MLSGLLFGIMLFVSTLAQAQTWQQLDSLGQALTKQQKLKEADSVLRIALKKVEQQHGQDTSYAMVVKNLGTVYFYARDYHNVEPFYLEAKSIYAKKLGTKNAKYISLCNGLALTYTVLGFYHKAEPFFLEAVSLKEAMVGKKNKEYALLITNLADLYQKSAQYTKAEPFLIEAKNIREEILGKKHADYATSCNNLGNFYWYTSQYAKAQAYYLESKNIFEELYGKKHTSYATLCNDLAALYYSQGLYHKAEPLYLEAKEIREEVLGKRHPEYGTICGNLAALYAAQGLYVKATPLFLEVKNIQESFWGKKHPYYTAACLNLANIYAEQGFYAQAEELYIEGKNIRELMHGKLDTDYASLCNSLGELYYQTDVYDKAELLFVEAMEVFREVLGEKSPNYAIACGNVANLYMTQNLPEKAKSYLIEAYKVTELTLGKKHPRYAHTCNQMALFYHRLEQHDKALEHYKESIQVKKEEMNTLFPTFSELEKQANWQSIAYFFHDFAKYAQSYAHQNPVIMADLYDQTLFTKGIIFSSTQKIKNTILNSGDTVLVNQYNNWKKQRETYTKLYQLSLEEQKMQSLDLDDMKNQINDLEKDLSKKSALFGQNVQTKSYKWQEVKAKLAKNDVVIEIIKADSAYIALFLTAQTEDYPAFYLFKNAKNLETNYLNFYKNCIEFKIEDTVSYNAFWKPIADKLLTLNKKGFKKIYLSPDGVFHQLSLNTLKNPKTNQFLLEEANIQLIGSSRDLIELNKKSRDLSQNYENYQAHLLGYPIYGTENGEPIKNRDRAAGFSGVQSAVGVAGAVSLLPGTKKEVENVFGLFNQKKLKVNLLLAENATEEALKNLKSPTILHVATHGFFIPEIKDSEVQDMQTAMNRNLLKNPFLRSGLLLAGCQKPNPEGEDGILTAEEVMNLTLDNTELVVMSACETGLGDIQAGEGVFGLQRAFQQAGAKSVLMSLWKVDDDATQTLMTEFYTALLKGQSKRQAFKTAQMNLKKRFPEPYYWGAFVMVGE